MTAIFFSAAIGPVPVDVVIREQHNSSLGITEIPIETGAKITDHAYVEPKKLVLEFADSQAALTYNALVRFQESRVPFVAVSGLYVYSNMLIKNLSAERDVKTSRVLSGKAELQEIIIVSTSYDATQGGAGESATGPGNRGGVRSTRAASPSPETTSGAATQNRAGGTVARGDARTSSVSPARSQSILRGLFQ